MVQYATAVPAVSAVWEIVEEDLESLATEITEAGQRTLTVVDGGLEWTGYFEQKRAEVGQFVVMSLASLIPDVVETSPFVSGALQECPQNARFAFQTE